MKKFFEDAAMQNHPLRAIKEFVEREKALETAKAYYQMRFVGYVLEIGFDIVTIITSDPFKLAVGGVPRNSFLIMLPSNYENLPPHFTLLRVLESAPTPLSKEVQQTYFELQKKSMPEIDVFTQSELQWGALKTSVLGMLYPNPDILNGVEFSGDLNNFVSAHKYRVYSPDDKLLNVIVNSSVPKENQFELGKLRMTESRLTLPTNNQPSIPVNVSTKDFMGTRTAMFGKTRLGKSNVVKLIVQSLIETTKQSKNVGQLIFDINGEYANDNPQDDNYSIARAYNEYCVIYALTKKDNTPSKPLKLDFYEHPDSSHSIVRTLLIDQGRKSIYIERFLSVDIPSIEQINELEFGEKNRAKRRILIYWAILKKAGFAADEEKLKSILDFDPGLNEKALMRIYPNVEEETFPKPHTLDELVMYFEKAAESDRQEKLQSSTKNKNLFDADDDALMNFLLPTSTISAGPGLLQGIRKFHSAKAGNFVNSILEELDLGKTVILDLGNANEEIMRYFSRELSEAVFAHQTTKFTSNLLDNHFIQIYFEEAHNLFAVQDSNEETKIYRRFAKEGAKYHIGMVYSTQSPTTINKDLLAQTENFFIAHISALDEVKALARLNVAYTDLIIDILHAKTPGYLRMLTSSHRFVIPVQANLFSPGVN